MLDQVDMVMHPVQTIKNVGSLISNVGYYLGKAVYEYGHLSYLTLTDPEAAHKKVETWHENTQKLATALYDQYQNSSGTSIARGTTRLLSGAIFGPKVTGAALKVLKKLPGKIAQKAAEVVRVFQEEERVHVTPEGLKVKVPSQNMNFIGKGKNVGGNKSKLKNVSGKAKETVKHSKTATKIGKYGKYEDAAYHTKIGNKVKSKAPIDGQHALNNSLQIKDTSPWRIAVSNNEFVVLSYTSPDLFHGHVRPWKDLEPEMQRVLIKAGLVTRKGKIIKR